MENFKWKMPLIIICIVVAIVSMFVFSFQGIQNKAISYEEQISTAESEIKVQEKRRIDLIPNLVDCVKAYDKHEYQQFNIPYASVYGDIIEEMTHYKKKKNKPTGKLITTGCNRTGCIFCGFGCHLEKEPNRFQRLKETHPKLWEYCMKPWEQGGLGMKKVLEYIKVKYEEENK